MRYTGENIMMTFEKWLAQNQPNAEKQLDAFGMLSLLCRQEKLTKTSLRQIERVEEIERIQEILDDRLQKYGKECCAEFQNALSLYAQYLMKSGDEGKKETLTEAIRRRKIPFVDKRAQGGALWIIGGKELSGFVRECRERGVYFQFCPGGGRSTQGRDAWYATGNAEFGTWKQMKMDT